MIGEFKELYKNEDKKLMNTWHNAMKMLTAGSSKWHFDQRASQRLCGG
jgi:hypothetical protein